MSTRSFIGKVSKGSNEVRYIYCHYDGYLDGVGDTLRKHWQNEADIDALLDGGDISSLGDDMDDTIFYARDRGEELQPAHSEPFDDEFGGEVDYTYVYQADAGKWFYRSWSSKEWKAL